jgi:1,4-dihydroxy-2-naphthoyl-CoA hydrolase
MFTYATSIRLKDTDATGVIYFAQMPTIALAAFEEAILKAGISLREILQNKDFLLPVVHMEADYLAPLEVGDLIDVHLKVAHVGETSFTLSYQIIAAKKQVEAGRVSIVHVVLSKQTKKSMPIPHELGKFLQEL